MCNACLEDDVAECNQEQTTQNCLSPTTDSCFTGAGRYKYNNGSTTVYIGIARGCVDCSSKEPFVYVYITSDYIPFQKKKLT